ncbi:MAG TPA: hypothetical protein VFX59_30295, partial [Polyangiales bacterium]|nr:hypothetical protein [Polyangiales bacterium]
VFAASRVLRKLWLLRLAPGYFIAYPVPWIVGSMVLTSLLLLLAPTMFRQLGIAFSAASERLWRYAAMNGMATGLLMAVYFAYGTPTRYYIQKFSLYTSVLLAIACVGPLTTLVTHLVERGPRWLLSLEHARFVWGASAFTAVAMFAAVQGYIVYWPMARERWLHLAPSKALYSNYEPAVDDFIEKTMREHKAGFGGYYDPFWPRTFTHNALHFFFAHARDHYFNGDFVLGNALFLEGPGLCFFVQGTPDEYLAGPHTEMVRQIQRLYNTRDVCTSFRPEWSERPLSVCAACL